jgi:cell division septum initiation protein DivIVA
MSGESIQEPMSTSSSKAAEIAARQVEQIVEAAQLAADKLHVDAEREIADRKREIEKEGERMRTDVQREADKIRDDARVEAVKVTEEARKKAAERIEAAEKAADEALADAEAISRGLRSLGSVLQQQAEILLRDVQAGHRRMRAELRVASGAGPGGGSALQREGREAAGSGGRRRPSRGTPFDDIELPNWVGPE